MKMRLRKCNTILLVLTLLAAILVLSPVAVGVQYTDSSNRYTIFFPNGWVKNDIIGVDVAYLDSVEDDVRENINVASTPESGVKDTQAFVKELAEEALDELERQYPDMNVIAQPLARIINGHWSVTYVIDLPLQGTIFRMSQTLIVSEGYKRVFVITCTATPSTYDTYESTFTLSINSFEIINEPQTDSFLDGLIIMVIAGAVIGGIAGGLGGYMFMKKKKKDELETQQRLLVPPAQKSS